MKEYRTAHITGSDPAGTDKVLTGVPIVFDQPTTINEPGNGSYTEIIERTALDDTDLSDVRLIYNHDNSRVPLARTPKTLNLSISPAGLNLSASLPETEAANEVYQAVKRGDLSGMSFAFTVPAGGDSYDPATRTRRIHKIAKVYECSIVPDPAYPQTSVEARSAIKQADTRQKVKTELLSLCDEIIG